MLSLNKINSILEYRNAYLAPEGSEERESAYKYEQYLHNKGIFIDKYDRTNLRAASKLHQRNCINGLLFQWIWFIESNETYQIEEVQNCLYINHNMTKDEKYNPDFIFKKSRRTMELKFTDSGKYFNKENYLAWSKTGELVEAKQMALADVVVVCSYIDGKLLEFYCIREKNNYNIRYIANNKRLETITKGFNALKVE